MSAENEALVRRYVEEVYDQRRLEVADEIFASDSTLHDPDLPGGARGPEGMKRVVQTFVGAFPDLEVSLDDELSSGEKVVTRWTSRGTHQGELMGIARMLDATRRRSLPPSTSVHRGKKEGGGGVVPSRSRGGRATALYVLQIIPYQVR